MGRGGEKEGNLKFYVPSWSLYIDIFLYLSTHAHSADRWGGWMDGMPCMRACCGCAALRSVALLSFDIHMHHWTHVCMYVCLSI